MIYYPLLCIFFTGKVRYKELVICLEENFNIILNDQQILGPSPWIISKKISSEQKKLERAKMLFELQEVLNLMLIDYLIIQSSIIHHGYS